MMTNKRKRQTLVERYPSMKELVDQADDSIIDIVYSISEMRDAARNAVISTLKYDLSLVTNNS